MKFILLLLTLCLTPALHAQQPAAAPTPHTFTSTDGRNLAATIIEKTDTTVTLRRAEDDAEFTLPLERLSAADRARVRDWVMPVTGRNDLSDRVLAFCKAQMGRRVGKGECAHLAVEALQVAGAGGRQADAPFRGDYVWGELTAFIRVSPGGVAGTEALGSIHPGDVVQLRDAKFAGQRPRGGTYTQTATHHTVIVERVDAAANVLHILHQNWSGNRFVVRGDYKISDLKQGWLRVYRPVLQSR